MLKLKEVSIEIISKCPSKCLHCSSFSSSDCSELITLDKFKEVVDDANTLGAHTICLSGGEPFLHPNIMEMIEHVNDLGLKSYIYTSGIAFDDNGMHSSLPQQILQRLAGKVSKLIFNVESSEEQAYDLIMGTQGCFPLLKSSVINAVCYKITCEAHFVPMKLNVEQIDATIQLCQELGITNISFLRLVLHGRAQDNKEQIFLDDVELELLKFKFASLAEFADDSPLKIRVGVPLSSSNSKNAQKCEAANGKLNIKYDGNVYPCEVFKNDAIKSGLNDLTQGAILHDRQHDIATNSNYLKSFGTISKIIHDEANAKHVAR